MMSRKVRWYHVEGVAELAQGLALDIDKALDEEAVDTRHLLYQLNALVDEAAVTSHLLDQLNDPLDLTMQGPDKILAAAATLNVNAALRCPDKMCQ